MSGSLDEAVEHEIHEPPSSPLKSDLPLTLGPADVFRVSFGPQGSVLCRLHPESHPAHCPCLTECPWSWTQTHTHTHVRMRQNRPRKRNSREPPGRSFLLKSPQWFRTAGLFTAIWQVSLKCQEHLPTPNLHTHPLRGPYGETPWTLQGQPDRWPVPDLPSSGSDLHPALLLVLEPLLPAAFLESRS